MYKKFIKYIIPTIIANIMQSLYCVVDAYFVGIKTGDTGLAAINIAWPIAATIIALGTGIGTGGAVLISYFMGTGDLRESDNVEKQTLKILGFASIISTVLFLLSKDFLLPIFGAKGGVLYYGNKYITVMILGSLFTIFSTGLLPILRNRGKGFLFMMVMTIAMITNVIGDYLLIYVLDLGITGAGIATTFAQGVSAAASFIILRRSNKEKNVKGKLNIKNKHEDKLHYKKIIKVALSPFIISLSPSFVLLITNWQCLKYGNESVVAAYAAITYLTFPMQRVVGGIAEGVQPLISFYYAKRDKEYIRKILNMAYISALILGILIAILLTVYKEELGMFFGLSSFAIGYFIQGMKINALLFLPIGYVKVSQAYLFSTLHEKKAFLILALESLVVSPLLFIILPVFLKINGVWWATTVTPVIIGIVCVFLTKNIFEKE